MAGASGGVVGVALSARVAVVVVNIVILSVCIRVAIEIAEKTTTDMSTHSGPFCFS